MPGKILGTQTQISSASTNTTIGTVPTGFWWAFSVYFCNTSTNNVKIKLALSAAAAPTAAEWIISEYEMEPNETFDITGLVLQAGKLVVVQADTANAISVTALGFEDPLIGV